MSLRAKIRQIRKDFEADIGCEVTNDFFRKALAYSVRKYRFQAGLGMHTLSEAEYLPLLLPDVLQELLFSEYTLYRSMKGGENDVRYMPALSLPSAMPKCS